MMDFPRILILIPICCLAVYTASYGVWTWKRQNRVGAFLLFLLAVITLLLPIYTLWIREA